MYVTDNLFSYIFAKNFEKRALFDKVIAKIRRCRFLIHIVVMNMLKIADCQFSSIQLSTSNVNGSC